MNSVIIAADILSTIIMLIIFCGSISNIKRAKRSTVLFIVCIAICSIGSSIDAVSYAIEGSTKNVPLLHFVNSASFLISCLVFAGFAMYMAAVIRELVDISYKIVLPVVVITGIDFFIILIGSINGGLFNIVDYKYVAGSWENVINILPLGCMLYLYVVLFIYGKFLGGRRTLALSTYMLFPTFTVGFYLITDSVDFAYPAEAFSLLVIYVTIQSQTIAESRLYAKVLEETSRIDSLTQLGNRRAYVETVQKPWNLLDIAAVFCDLNSLKSVNDTYGHAEGDKYIIKFANLLTENFKGDAIFRISGDEFVVLLRNTDSEELERKVGVFREVINQNNRMAAIGVAYGGEGTVLDLVRRAEKEMYKDKSRYYKETGRDRRS